MGSPATAISKEAWILPTAAGAADRGDFGRTVDFPREGDFEKPWILPAAAGISEEPWNFLAKAISKNRGFFPRRRARRTAGLGRAVDRRGALRCLFQSLCLGKGMSVCRMAIVGARPAQKCGGVGLVHFSRDVAGDESLPLRRVRFSKRRRDARFFDNVFLAF